MNRNDEDFQFSFVDKYFKENSLVDHHITSCDNFYDVSIPKIFKDKNPIRYYGIMDEKTKQYKYSARLFLGGKKADKIYYGKPMIYDGSNQHYMFPNEARLRNMTYGISIHYDVDLELEVNGELVTRTLPLNKTHYFLGMFPIMLQSKLCILKGLPVETRFQMGECKYDYGGYFIVDGKEKVLIPQESFGNNLIYTRLVKDGKHDFSVEVRSVSEDISKPRRTLAIRRVQKGGKYSNEQFVVFIPDVREPIPLFIVMRALGITSDKEICQTILHDLDRNEDYLELLRPSIHDGNLVFHQKTALEFIGSFTKLHTVHAAYRCLVHQLLPHIGEMNFKAKACYIGYMVFELLKLIRQEELPTDRDNYKYKRVQSTGQLMKDLFIEYATEMYNEVYKTIDKELYYHNSTYDDEEQPPDQNYKFLNLFSDELFTPRTIEEGFRKGFKGNWGAHGHTKRVGVIQALNRLTYHSFMSHLRRVDLDIDESNKLVGPHLLHGSQYGLFDPLDVGGSVGIDKQMAVLCAFTPMISNEDLFQWIQKNMTQEELRIHFLEEIDYRDMTLHTKLFINGSWIGIVKDPLLFKEVFITARRLGLVHPMISIAFDMKYKSIFLFSDEGRVVRPLFYFEKVKAKDKEEKVISYKGRDCKTWSDCVRGTINTQKTVFLNKNDLSEAPTAKSQTVLEYLDNSEMETLFVTSTVHVPPQHDYTHAEIHPSCLFGIMGNQIVFPENSALPRNDYSCIQGRQSVSLYHSNYLNRIDNMGILLDYGQKPIVKSRYTRYLNNEALPYGENAIVAIMTHTGYNVEDSILINESAVKRGLFHTTYYTMYETYEETGSLAGNSEKRIANVTKYPTTNLKPGYNYNELDEHGLIKVGTILSDKMVMIGRIQFQKESPDKIADASVFSSKGHTGIVDRVYLTENEEGKRIAKIRVREERVPEIGDKFSSRCGQKGTIGTLIPEENMPFTKDGIRPDLIINPHCMPSRMTINQLIECLFSKMAVDKGISVDCTAFVNKGPKHAIVGGLLQEYGYHSSGNDLLYNGMTGEQIESQIFIGPTYYLRLKHMVQDKINYRAGGPRVALTRQTNHGRSNDGGLKIGDMERDCILSHGMSAFMCDSMMKRGDAYQMAICNQSGSIAIYHRDTQQFYSPMIDGPLTFEKTESDTFTPSLITKYGKEFSKVDVPYCLKLLIHELTAMNVQMRLITSDNIENLTTYGKKTLGKFEEYVKKSAVFEQMTLDEKEALSRDVQSLKQSGTYTPLAEKQSRDTILRARQELEQKRITPEDYRQLLKMPVVEPEPVPVTPPALKIEPELEELEEYNPIVENETPETSVSESSVSESSVNERKDDTSETTSEGDVKKIVLKGAESKE